MTVETRWFPPLDVQLGGADTGPPNLVTRVLQPKVTLKYHGGVLASVAPGGEPVPSQWPKVRIGLIVAGAVVAFSLLRILR